jgi:hypothetical protein
MTEPVCAGCGEMLPRPRERGRPATYHGPACRQRARRARLSADPARTDLLALLDRAGRAVAGARRAVTSGEDARAALAELVAVAELVEAAQTTEVAATSCVNTERGSADAPEPTVAERSRKLRRQRRAR